MSDIFRCLDCKFIGEPIFHPVEERDGTPPPHRVSVELECPDCSSPDMEEFEPRCSECGDYSETDPCERCRAEFRRDQTAAVMPLVRDDDTDAQLREGFDELARSGRLP